MASYIEFFKQVMGFVARRFRAVLVEWSTWWYVYLPGEFIQLLLGVFTYFFLLSAYGVTPEVALSYLITGLAVNAFLRTAITGIYWSVHGLFGGYLESGGFRLRQWEYYRLARIPRAVAIAGLSIFESLRAFSVMLLYLFIGVAFFSLRIAHERFLLALLITLLGYAATATMGVLVASTFWLFVRYRELTLNPFMWLIDVLAPLVCGVYFPQEALPPLLRSVGLIFPQTHALRAIRATLAGSLDFQAIVCLLAYVALLPLAVKVFKALERYAVDKSGYL